MANPAIPGAKELVQQFLDQYGLGALGGWAWMTYIGAGGGTTGMDAITAELPNQPQFKARFPAYEQLRREGRAMSINDMLSYEQSARQIFHAAGIPAGFYDQPSDFAKFMLGDVSTSELQQRVQDAQTLVMNSPADVRAQAKTLFGLDNGHLIAHFLDPNVAEPILQKQVTASQLGAEAQRADLGQLTRQQAMGLAQFGVTQSTGDTGFQKLGLEKGLFQQQVQGEKAIGLDEQLKATFEGDTTAQLAFQQRQAARLAAFQASSGANVTQAGVAGLAPSQRGV